MCDSFFFFLSYQKFKPVILEGGDVGFCFIVTIVENKKKKFSFHLLSILFLLSMVLPIWPLMN